MGKQALAPSNKSNPEKELALLHCEAGDPCECVIEIRTDGTVWVNALCGEILPVVQALSTDIQQPT